MNAGSSAFATGPQILGRAVANVPFAELATSTLVVGATPVAFTPAVPPAATDQKLQLRVLADDNVTIRLGEWLDPATRPGPTPIKDDQDRVTGEEPAPWPTTLKKYVAWGQAPRQIPFTAGNSIVLSRPGLATAA
jgi:hypothetical protein